MRSASPAIRIRPTALVLVMLAHVPLALLFLWGWRISRDEPEPALVFIGVWPSMREAATAAADSSSPPPRATQGNTQRNEAPVRAAPAPPAPQLPPESGAITLPVESATSGDSAAPKESTGASIDWEAEGRAAAARQGAPASAPGFSAPPKVMRKACEKPKSSWEWNPEPKKAGITPIPYGVPLPYVVLGRCVVGLGFFGCALQKPPEANSHLLDDMRAGKTSPSSVPDPELCD